MSFWNESLNTFASNWLETLIRACWQGGLALALVWTLCRWGRIPAWGRCWLWRLAFLKLLFALLWLPTLDLPLLPPANPTATLTLPQDLVQASPAIAESIPAASISVEPPYAEPAPTVTPTLAGWLLLLWASSLLWQSGQAIQQGLTVHRLRRSGKPLDGGSLDCWNVALSRDLNLPVVPRLLSSTATSTPLLIGGLHPCIVLPESLLATCTPDELRLILAHELAHVRRCDLLWGWLPLLTRLVCGFHPLVRYAERELGMAQEIACDEAALHLTGAAVAAYGNLLVRVAARFAPRHSQGFGMIGMTESYHTLKRRLSAMKSFPSTPRPYRVAVRFGLLTLGLAALLPWRVAAQATPPVPPTPTPTIPVNSPTPLPPTPAIPATPAVAPTPPIPTTPVTPIVAPTPIPASPAVDLPAPIAPVPPPPTATQAVPTTPVPPVPTAPAVATPAGRRSAKATKKSAQAVSQDPTVATTVSVTSQSAPSQTTTVSVATQNDPARPTTVTIARDAAPRTATVTLSRNAAPQTSTVTISRSATATSAIVLPQNTSTASTVTSSRVAPVVSTVGVTQSDATVTAPQGYPVAAPDMISSPKPAPTATTRSVTTSTRSVEKRGTSSRTTVDPRQTPKPARAIPGATPGATANPFGQPSPSRAASDPFASAARSKSKRSSATDPPATPALPTPASPAIDPFARQTPTPPVDPASPQTNPVRAPIDPAHQPAIAPTGLPVDPVATPPVAIPPGSDPTPRAPKASALQAPILRNASRGVPVLSDLPILGRLFRLD